MNFNSKKTSLIILGIASLLCSRATFAFFNDPEGPNLLIVTVFAAILFVLTMAVNRYCLPVKQDGLKRLLLLIGVEILIAAGFYLFLS
jgi:hypothetical protein